MNAYYADFKLLLDQARTYGKPVIVQVEPDLWGYLEQKAGSCGKASCVSAAVASSGYADVAAFPNTVQGFAEALLHLRDKYAPNVIMAIHASCWGSGADVCNYPTSLTDTASHAAQDAAFLASAGISGQPGGASSWDLVFTDTSDRDAGYYQYVYGNSHTLVGSHQHDAAQLRQLPHLAGRHQQRAPAGASCCGRRRWATSTSRRRTTPTATTRTTARSTSWATARLRPPERLRQRRRGRPALRRRRGRATTNTDAKGDGMTNPAPVNSFQCNACNTHVSQYSDDDGGYLRIFGGVVSQGWRRLRAVQRDGRDSHADRTDSHHHDDSAPADGDRDARPANAQRRPRPRLRPPPRPPRGRPASPTATGAPATLAFTSTARRAGPATVAPGQDARVYRDDQRQPLGR